MLQQVKGGTLDHYQFLAALHATLLPSVYVETGVERGHTLALAKCRAIGIDPNPVVSVPLPETASVFSETSDDFFKNNDLKRLTSGLPIDLAFIDGLHLFEAAMSDFMNIEKYCHPGSVICVHDVVPHTVKMAQREPQSDGWTGDVFGLILALREHRPDLFSVVLDIAPTGMLVISNCDPSNKRISRQFSAIFKQHLALDYYKLHDNRDEVFGVTSNASLVIDFLGRNAALQRASNDYMQLRRALSSDQRVRIGGQGHLLP